MVVEVIKMSEAMDTCASKSKRDAHLLWEIPNYLRTVVPCLTKVTSFGNYSMSASLSRVKVMIQDMVLSIYGQNKVGHAPTLF